MLAANQDNYVKAFTYRPLRALVGNGLLTSEGDYELAREGDYEAVGSLVEHRCFIARSLAR